MIGRNFPQFNALWTNGGLDLTTDFVVNRYCYDHSNSFSPNLVRPAEGVLRRVGISQWTLNSEKTTAIWPRARLRFFEAALSGSPVRHSSCDLDLEIKRGVSFDRATGTPLPPGFTDPQSWTRDQFLDPDWLRVGTDIVGGNSAPTLNAAFTLNGVTVPAPLAGAGLPGLIFAGGCFLALARQRRRQLVA
jgi:hypothetical protein